MQYLITAVLFTLAGAAAWWGANTLLAEKSKQPSEPTETEPEKTPENETKSEPVNEPEKTDAVDGTPESSAPAQSEPAPAAETTSVPSTPAVQTKPETASESDAAAKPKAETAADQTAPYPTAWLVGCCAVGLGTGIGAGYTIGLSWMLFPVLVAFGCLGCGALVDYRLRLLPNELSLIMLLACIVNLVLVYFTNHGIFLEFLYSCVMGGSISFLLLLLVSRIAHGGFGMGDVKLLAALGALCGSACIMSTAFFAVLTAAVVAILLLLFKKVGLKYSMPFGPFIFFGYVAAVVLGLC